MEWKTLAVYVSAGRTWSSTGRDVAYLRAREYEPGDTVLACHALVNVTALAVCEERGVGEHVARWWRVEGARDARELAVHAGSHALVFVARPNADAERISDASTPSVRRVALPGLTESSDAPSLPAARPPQGGASVKGSRCVRAPLPVESGRADSASRRVGGRT